jgi:hypothetical protein
VALREIRTDLLDPLVFAQNFGYEISKILGIYIFFSD